MSQSYKNFYEKVKKEFTPVATAKIRADRILYLDFIKIFAAFLTVFYHLAYYYLDYGFMPGMTYYPNLSRVVMCFASCCVPLFFMVNGSLMLGHERRIRDVYLKAVKIAFLTVVWSFLDFPSWFFKTLCILYVLFPIFQFIKNRSEKLYYIICGIVFLFPFTYNLIIMVIKFIGLADITIFGVTLPINSLDRTGFFSTYSILYFLLGPILSTAKKLPILLDLSLVFSGLTLVVLECVVYTNLTDTMFDGVNDAFPTIGALLLSTGLFLFFKKFSFKIIAKPLLFICNGIFAIYILHISIIKFIPTMFSESLLLSLLVSFVICLTGASVGKLASKIPMICWFFKI